MRGVREIGRPFVYGDPVASTPFNLGTVGSGKTGNFTAATVTETAILRSKIEDLEALAGAQAEELRQLRRQVVALRDGARLAEEP